MILQRIRTTFHKNILYMDEKSTSFNSLMSSRLVPLRDVCIHHVGSRDTFQYTPSSVHKRLIFTAWPTLPLSLHLQQHYFTTPGLQLHFWSSPILVFFTSGLHHFWSPTSLLVFTTSGLLHYWSSTGHHCSATSLVIHWSSSHRFVTTSCR